MNNKITNSYCELIEKYKFEIKNSNTLYNKGSNNLINNNYIGKGFKENQKCIFLKSKQKVDKHLNENGSKNKTPKNFIYEKEEEFNKKYVYNYIII